MLRLWDGFVCERSSLFVRCCIGESSPSAFCCLLFFGWSVKFGGSNFLRLASLRVVTRLFCFCIVKKGVEVELRGESYLLCCVIRLCR